MNAVTLSLGLIVVLFSVYMLVHVGLFRRLHPSDRWSLIKKIFYSAIVIVAATAVVLYQYLLPTEPAGFSFGSVTGALVLLWLLHNGYLMFYAFVERSLSIRTVCEFYDIGNRPLNFEDLVAQYDPRASYYRRLAILTESGYFEGDGSADGFRLTSKGVKLAKSVKWLKDLYQTGPGG